MTRQVLFIHGGGGGAWEADAKLADSLRASLGPAYAVRYPRMPDEEQPDYATWKRLIHDDLAAMGPGAVLVGHSIGASVAIKLMTEADGPRGLAGVVLLAAPFWHDHEVWRWDEVRLAEDAATPAGTPVIFLHGAADEVVPAAHLEMFERALPTATFRVLEGRDHQFNEDMGVVADLVSRVFAALRPG